MTTQLKLKAESPEDLKVLSAILQDAIVRIGDIHLSKDARTLTIVASRFMHESGESRRIKTGLRFNNILGMQASGINRVDPDAFAVLLSVEFKAGKPKPEGEVSLIFAGGGELRAKAEYLEAHLVDYSIARETNSQPMHPIDG